MPLRRAALALLGVIAGCQGGAESLVEDGPAIALPFASIHVTQLYSSSVRRSRSSSPNLAPEEVRDTSDDDSLFLQYYRDDGFLTAGGIGYGLSSVGCYEEGIRSDVLILYTPGGRRQDSFTCVGDPTSSSEEKYKVSYSSTANLDGDLLQLNGSMNASGTETYIGRTAKVTVKYTEKLSIRLKEQGCEIVEWQQNREEKRYIAQTTTHYSNDDSSSKVNRLSARTQCQLYK